MSNQTSTTSLPNSKLSTKTDSDSDFHELKSKDSMTSSTNSDKIFHKDTTDTPEAKANRTRHISDSALGSITENEINIETKTGTIKFDISDKLNCEMWIFGYGSLLWRPNFEYNLKLIGHIKGYKRRFWQGNTFHRGSLESKARVATLIPQSQLNDVSTHDLEIEQNKTVDEIYTTYGLGFQLKGRDHILGAVKHLNMRETQLGGYDVIMTEFFPMMEISKKIMVMVFTATTENPIYLGPASSAGVAKEICAASGACGTNVEYLLKLCQWQKQNVPFYKDNHLTNIETHCLYIIRDQLEQEQQIARSSSPSTQPADKIWLSEPWVKSYIDLRKISSSIKCTCHDSPAKNPAEFFGKFGPHYI